METIGSYIGRTPSASSWCFGSQGLRACKGHGGLESKVRHLLQKHAVHVSHLLQALHPSETARIFWEQGLLRVHFDGMQTPGHRALGFWNFVACWEVWGI